MTHLGRRYPGDEYGPPRAQTIVKRLFDEHPLGVFQEVIRVGFTGMDGGDLVLAKACADYVLSRAETGSGDMMRAMLLRAYVYERTGKSQRSNELLSAVIDERF
jgi:hypothetical protein